MNFRNLTKGLTTDQIKELSEAWHHAKRIGLSLNTLVTFRPATPLTPEEHNAAYAGFRNKIGVYARQHHFTPASVWSRECNPDGSGEHLHMLVHVPAKWRRHFEETVI